jgi:hypothetical protein
VPPPSGARTGRTRVPRAHALGYRLPAAPRLKAKDPPFDASLPLDRRRRLGGNVVDDPVNYTWADCEGTRVQLFMQESPFPLDVRRLKGVPRSRVVAQWQLYGAMKRFRMLCETAESVFWFEAQTAKPHWDRLKAEIDKLQASQPPPKPEDEASLRIIDQEFRKKALTEPAIRTRRAVRVAAASLVHTGLDDMLLGILGSAAYFRPKSIFEALLAHKERREANPISLEDFLTRGGDDIRQKLLDRWWCGMSRRSLPYKLRVLCEILPEKHPDFEYDKRWVEEFDKIRHEAIHGDPAVVDAANPHIWFMKGHGTAFSLYAHLDHWDQKRFSPADRDCFQVLDIVDADVIQQLFTERPEGAKAPPP